MAEIEVRCPKCVTVFYFDLDDVPKVDSGPGGDDTFQLNCPHCGEVFNFDIVED